MDPLPHRKLRGKNGKIVQKIMTKFAPKLCTRCTVLVCKFCQDFKVIIYYKTEVVRTAVKHTISLDELVMR